TLVSPLAPGALASPLAPGAALVSPLAGAPAAGLAEPAAAGAPAAGLAEAAAAGFAAGAPLAAGLPCACAGTALASAKSPESTAAVDESRTCPRITRSPPQPTMPAVALT